jgi:hypothetical protein
MYTIQYLWIVLFLSMWLSLEKLFNMCHCINRVGDFGLALGIMGCFITFQTLDF